MCLPVVLAGVTLALAAGVLAQDGTLTRYPPEWTIARLKSRFLYLCPYAGHASDEPGVRHPDPAPYTLHLDDRALPACSAVLYLDAPGVAPAVDDTVQFVEHLRERATAAVRAGHLDGVPRPRDGGVPRTVAQHDGGRDNFNLDGVP